MDLPENNFQLSGVPTDANVGSSPKQEIIAWQHYKHLIETAPDAIFIADVQTGIILEANNSAARLLGLPLNQIIGMHQSQLHPSQEEQRYRDIFQEHIRKGSGFIIDDVYALHASGRKVPIQINASVTRLGDREIIFGIFRDVTEQKRLLKELQDSQERFKRLTETYFEAILIHKDGKFIDGNPKLFEIFGYTEEEFRRISVFDLSAPESRKIVKKNFALKLPTPHEVMGLKKDGTVFPTEVHARQSQINGDTVRIVVFRDMTRQKEMERKLAESEKKYRELYHNARVALFRSRLDDGKLIECNEAFVELLGYDSRQQCLAECSAGKHWPDLSLRTKVVEEMMIDGYLRNYQIPLIRCDGTHLWVEVAIKLNPQENYVEGSQIDITAAKVLTKIEKGILHLIGHGWSNKEIAKQLSRSIRTIEDHRANIMKKLHVTTLAELTKKAQFLHIDTGNK
jgi:PAS domain S-box-containing protein